jgi:L-amino acid N-acyltransferase YncA
MEIRDADPDRDGAPCAAIYAPFVLDTAVSFEEVPPTPGEFAERIRNTTVTHPWIVAEDGGQVIGYAYAARHRTRAAYRWAADVAVYIGTDDRRTGTGRRLYEALFERLREQGLRTVCAGITLPNEASIGLHRALGFEPVGTYRRIGWKAGRWYDVAWWQLDLAPGNEGPPIEPSPPVSGRVA